MRKKQREIRQLLVREAARLMVEEGVDQYLDAKRIAAKRLLGKEVKMLPSNGEIADEVHRLASFQQGAVLQTTLFEMRLLALDTMEQLEPFRPRLIGSVSTGRIRKGSDIDIHVFCDQLEMLYQHLEFLGLKYESKLVCIRRNNRLVEYTHVYLDFEYPVELSVYPAKEIRVAGRSSTDGKPIKRISASRLQSLMEDEHSEAWRLHVTGYR